MDTVDFILPEIKKKILILYSGGMSVLDISTWTYLSMNEVNLILDQIIPYL